MSPKERKDFVNDWNMEDGAIFLDPPEKFDGGIIGVTEDKCHIVYSYDKLVESIAKAYKEYAKGKTEETDEDFISQAAEWIDFNTLGYLPYMNQDYVPIIIYEI